MKRTGRWQMLLALLLSSGMSFAVIAAQTPSPATSSSRTGAIGGKVTLGGEPLPSVRVVLIWFDRVRPDRIDIFARAVSDSEGRYLFANLPAGYYFSLPFAPGSLLPMDMHGNQKPHEISLAEGETIENADLILTRGGVITGQVSDTGGKPVIEQKVNLLRVDAQRGSFPWSAGYQEMHMTDDRGIYRVYGVPPGRYRVSVGSNPAVVVPRLNEPGRYFTQTFHPGTTVEAEAALIEVSEGSVVEGVDIRMGPPSKSYGVYGRVINAETGKPVAGVVVGYGATLPELFISGSSSGPRSDLDGAFQINGALPGKYRVFAAAGGGSDYYCDPVPIEVTDRDVTGVEIKLKRGRSLSGAVVLEGRFDSDAKDLFSSLGLDAYNVPSNGIAVNLPTARIETNGHFRLTGLQPGKLHLHLSHSAMFRGLVIERIEHPSLDEMGAIEIAPDAQVTSVRVILRQASAAIRVRVNVIGGRLPSGARIQVAALRIDSKRYGSHDSAEMDARGIFLIPRLVPGEYEVIALLVPISASEVISTSKLATAVKQVAVVDGQTAEVELTLDLSQK